MRSQKELVLDGIEKLDCIIKKMQEFSTSWRKKFETISSNSGSDDDLIILSHQIRDVCENAFKVAITEFCKDTKDLCDVVVNSHALFRDFEARKEKKE